MRCEDGQTDGTSPSDVKVLPRKHAERARFEFALRRRLEEASCVLVGEHAGDQVDSQTERRTSVDRELSLVDDGEMTTTTTTTSNSSSSSTSSSTSTSTCTSTSTSTSTSTRTSTSTITTTTTATTTTTITTNNKDNSQTRPCVLVGEDAGDQVDC